MLHNTDLGFQFGSKGISSSGSVSIPSGPYCHAEDYFALAVEVMVITTLNLRKHPSRGPEASDYLMRGLQPQYRLLSAVLSKSTFLVNSRSPAVQVIS